MFKVTMWDSRIHCHRDQSEPTEISVIDKYMYIYMNPRCTRKERPLRKMRNDFSKPLTRHSPE